MDQKHTDVCYGILLMDIRLGMGHAPHLEILEMVMLLKNMNLLQKKWKVHVAGDID